MIEPTSLNDWDFALVESLCKDGPDECSWYDFKEVLHPERGDKSKYNATLLKLACAFANSGGGFIVFGVTDSRDIEGLSEDREFGKAFGDKMRSIPALFYHPPKAISVPGSDSYIYVVHVPKSPGRPHVPRASDDKAVFWKRTNKGCEPMTLEEIREGFMDYETRWDKLRLLALELEDCEGVLQILSGEKRGRGLTAKLHSEFIGPILSEVLPLLRSAQNLAPALISLRRGLRDIEAIRLRILTQMPQGHLRPGWEDAIKQEIPREISSCLKQVRMILQTLESEFGITRSLT